MDWRTSVLSLLLCVSFQQVMATEYVLSPDERGDLTATSGEFKSIQAALNRTLAGDIITLMPGTYLVNLQFPRKGVTLRGDPASEPDDVVLDGTGCDPSVSLGWCTVVVFYWEEDGGEIENGSLATLENLTVTGGWPVYDDYGGEAIHGGGLWLDEANPNLNELNIVDNLSGDKGGGIYLEKASPVLNQVNISENTAVGSGAGFYMILGTPVLNRVTISDNHSEWRGGGLFLGRSAPSLSQVTIRNNWAAADGGGMYLNSSSPFIEGVTLLENGAGADGGGLYLMDSSPVVSQVSLVSNSAIRAGGGLLLNDSSIDLHNSIFANNSAGSGPNIQCYDLSGGGCSSTIEHSLVWIGKSSDPGFANIEVTESTLIADPHFVDIDAGELRLSYPDSAAIDAGSVLCFNLETEAFDLSCTDPDGSISDMGAFGGPRAGGDFDGDGSPLKEWWPQSISGQAHLQNDQGDQLDCDDNNAIVFPGAPELDDGLDNDCDGLVDENIDEDPEADDRGCGCASSSSLEVASAWLFFLTALIIRRKGLMLPY